MIEARDEAPRDNFAIDAFAVEELLTRSVQTLTGEATPERAWRAILGPGERIVILFDAQADRLQETSDTLGRVLVRQITSAGYDLTGITLVNAPERLSRSLNTRPPEHGWGQAIPVGRQMEQIPSYLDEADAVINISTLAAQPIGGVSGCVQNAALSFVRHPARYYRDDGPTLASQVLMNERVNSKIRINIVNALRIILEGGADAPADQVVGFGGLFVGFDPVAVDTQALSVLLHERHQGGIHAPIDSEFLDAATELGLGRRQIDAIQRIPISLGG
ncbi:MAG: DUF362 domain-containing protein [Phycisphaerae bacterium]|nr:DUF362 domain-containing protein [Phycisphaerae bacterium]